MAAAAAGAFKVVAQPVTAASATSPAAAIAAAPITTVGRGELESPRQDGASLSSGVVLAPAALGLQCPHLGDLLSGGLPVPARAPVDFDPA